LLEALGTRGFGLKWLYWIRLCPSSEISSVLINGVEGRKFTCKRGLREDDPISPHPFCIGSPYVQSSAQLS